MKTDLSISLDKQDLRVAPLSKGTFFALSVALLAGALSLFVSSPKLTLGLRVGAGVALWFGLIQFFNALSPAWPKFLERAMHWLYAMSFEGPAVLGAIALRTAWSLFPRKMGKEKGRPILLVHGYLHNCTAWVYHRPALVKRGLGPIYSINLKNLFFPLSDYVEQLRSKIEEIQKETGQKEITLIGHSMGGLISAAYATREGVDHVPQVITIGSPLKGTRLAPLGIGANAKEMRCGSPFLMELQQKMASCSSSKFYHIATETDQIVLPFSSALFGRNGENQFTFADLGHLSLLFSPRVVRKVSEWISFK